MLSTLPNFLTKKECDELIKQIDKSNSPSKLATEDDFNYVDSSFRSSSTSNLDETHPLVFNLKQKAADVLKVPIENCEQAQGQLYKEGQLFKPHQDAFSGKNYTKYCLASGNRTFTFMIYLNEVEEGGHTFFSKFNTSSKPETGKALYWNNLINERINHDTIHEGQPVVKGKKYIITLWFREKEYNPKLDEVLYLKYKKSNKPYFTSENFPKLGITGYQMLNCNETAFNLSLDVFKLIQYIAPHNINAYPALSQYILESIGAQLNTSNPNYEIVPYKIEGFSIYSNGIEIPSYRGKIEDGHIRVMLVIAKNIENPEDNWPLNFTDYLGKKRSFKLEEGNIFMYEHLNLAISRPKFKGKSYTMLNLSYNIKNYLE